MKTLFIAVALLGITGCSSMIDNSLGYDPKISKKVTSQRVGNCIVDTAVTRETMNPEYYGYNTVVINTMVLKQCTNSNGKKTLDAWSTGALTKKPKWQRLL